MPKQPGDKSKAIRIKHVLAAVEKLGRASPQQVFDYVTGRFDNVGNLKNFKSRISKDLKEYTDEGTLSCIYLTPDGAEVEEENKGKNFRKEYFLRDGNEQVRGGKLLSEIGACFYPQEIKSLVSWEINKFSESIVTFKKNHIVIIFESYNEDSFVISVPKVDLPFNLIIGRNKHDFKVDMKKIRNKFDPRTSLLFLEDKKMSADMEEKRHGHAIVKFLGDGKTVNVTDFDSTNTTLLNSSRETCINGLKQRLKLRDRGSRTRKEGEDYGRDPVISTYNKNKEWEVLSNTETSVPLPISMQLGNYQFFLCSL